MLPDRASSLRSIEINMPTNTDGMRADANLSAGVDPAQSTPTDSDYTPSTIKKAELSGLSDDSLAMSDSPQQDTAANASTRVPPTTT